MQYRPHMLFSNEIGNFDYGEDHPMKPERISMVFDLLKGYDILDKFKLIQAQQCTEEDLAVFHDTKYINFMQNYNTLSYEEQNNHRYNINIQGDVPAFPNFYQFSKLSGGSSLIAANIIAQ